MKTIAIILALGLLSPCASPSANAEGLVHWTARHVHTAAVETGNTLTNVSHTAARTIHHRTRPLRHAFR